MDNLVLTYENIVLLAGRRRNACCLWGRQRQPDCSVWTGGKFATAISDCDHAAGLISTDPQYSSGSKWRSDFFALFNARWQQWKMGGEFYRRYRSDRLGDVEYIVDIGSAARRHGKYKRAI